MKYRYSKFVSSLADEIDLESLVSRLSDLLLASGFNNPWDPQSDDDRSMQALYDAILDALLNGGVLSDEMLERLQRQDATPEERQAQSDQIEELIQRIMERLSESGYISMTGKPDAQNLDGEGQGERVGRTQFEVTDKALDFLGYRALRDLLGSIGRASAGRHDTRELDTGIEVSGPPRAYEFGDTLNLDATATVLNAVRRAGSAGSAGSAGPAGPALRQAQGRRERSRTAAGPSASWQ